ncbi:MULTISPECIES: low temperature requirement protein A [Roseobacteraceae]|uniref:Bacterial low temperature requirement A protein (LtrA) n=1 Tax=Pseudosulfitobacter pseudonitzschiae TaxID=1402135 RepID=A0A221JWD9_9RHOB|nr:MULTISPECIES: low temperature requirement protein A [Roseobacteraceae]ASM71022.1 bacterial low temperature requirement A protein (LtrA) [Pseudosulfitobacter pseudonitzschiae]
MPSMLHRLVPSSALRTLDPEQTPHVTTMELFFDLVYVFTIIQLSHYLLEHATWLGALEYVTLFAAVWWAWNYTAWAANWVNPDHPSGRGLMVVLMGCALLMAVAAPQAFSDRAGLFAIAYVAMALIRAGYMVLIFRGQVMGRNYAQLGLWSAISGVFWILGALIETVRLELWIVAVLIDYAGPYAGFWLPGKGATPMSSWTLRGLHLFERNQLIFIIALGESILLLGGYLVSHEIHFDIGLAALIGFLLIVTLWWVYFVDLSEPGEQRFEHETDHASLARAGLAYAHGVAVCGAIVTAVAIEMIVAHPLDPIHVETALIAFAGPSLFLLGCTIFHRVTAERLRALYLLAVVALAAWAWVVLSLHLNGLWLGAGVLLIMMTMAALGHQRVK